MIEKVKMMLEEKATIIRVENSQTWVEVKSSQSGCNSCQQKSSCGTSVLSGLFKESPKFFKVNNEINAQKGENVVIGIEENTFLKASFMGYMLPLLSMILFAMVGQKFAVMLHFSSTDFTSIIFGLSGLFIGLKGIAAHVNKQHQRHQYSAKVLRKERVNHLVA